MHELTETATAAVNKLRQSLTRRAGTSEPRPPARFAMNAKLGKKAKFRFRVSEQQPQGPRAGARVRTALRPVREPDHAAADGGARGSFQSVGWRVPGTLIPGNYRFCVLATDKAGNASKTSCAKLVLKKP